MTTQKKTTIGGQAIIEGIVMKGPKKSCTVVRRANGELVSKTEPTPSRAPIWEKPIFRGAYTLFTAMKENFFSSQSSNLDGGTSASSSSKKDAE